MDWTQVVYVTAWHRAFFQPLLPHSQDAHTNSASAAQLLRLLEACGYTKASLWHDKLCEDGKAEAIDWSSIRTSLQALTSETIDSKTVWPQRFFALCALHTLQDCKSSSAPNARGNSHSLHELLTQSLSSATTSAPQNTGDAAEVTQQEQAWWQAQVQAVLSHTPINSAMADAASSSLLFSLATTSPTTTTTTPSATHTTHKAELMQVWQEARLYGMLALATSFTQVRSLARLLAMYVVQEHAALAHGLFGDTAPHAHTAQANATRNGSERSFSVRRRQCMRVRGLVCGVAEYALHVSQAEAGRVRHSLRTLQDNTNSTSHTEGAQLLDVLPRVGEEATIRTAAVLLLMQVAEQLSTLDKLLQISPTAASSSSSSSSSMAEEWSVSVLHTMHELLFTLVLGAGTCAMPNRPAIPARNNNSTSASTTANATSSSSSGASYLALPYSVTRRALTLAEADAFVQCIFPALMQQLGYEWPWSAMLRHCRALDRLTAPATITTSSKSTSRSQGNLCTVGCVAAQMPVRWTSRMLIDSLLLALRPRTYLERLQQVLPPSYDRILDALGFAVVHKGNDETEGTKDTASTAMLFALPPYYAEAGAVLVEYLTRTSLSGWTEAELQRLLVQSTASLPMLVQLRALAPRMRTATSSIHGGGLYDASIIEQDSRNEEEAVHEEDAEYELTAAQLHALETRYRAEVLLVSLIVYTQLRTASQVQHAMRQAAPLLTRLLLELHDFYRLAGLQPFLVRRTQQRASNSNGEGSVAAGFTRVAELLMNRVGYQFYPLEWLPSYAQAYYDKQTQHQQQQQQHAAVVADIREVGMAMPYSVYAAVGHQLGLTLHNVPQGSAGAMSQRLPAGPRASLLTAADTPASLLLFSQHSEGGGEDEDVAARRANKAWECVERFVRVGMLDVYLQSRTASWELEGPLAVASTRRLIPQNNMNHSSAGALQSGIAGLLSLEPLAYSENTTAHDNTTGNSSSKTAVQPVWQPKLWHLLCTQQSNNEKRSTNNGGGEVSARERAGVRALQRVLLRSGAASFADVPQAADFAATLAQCFLPSSVSGAAQGSSSSAGNANGLLTQRLLQGAHEWCRARVANASDMARLRTLTQQLGQSNSNNNTRNNNNNAAAASVCGRLARLYNSGTFDASALARDVLREVPARLRAKLEQRMQEEQEYHDMNDEYDDGGDDGDSSKKNKATTVVPDPLLMHQWSTWQQMLHSLGLSNESNNNNEEEDKDSVMPSVTQWLWYSPYVQVSACMSGQDAAMTSAGQQQQQQQQYSCKEGSNGAVALPAMSPQATFSVSELRTAVQQHLQRTGALRQLKTQLRAMMLEGVLQQRRRLEAAAFRASVGSSALLQNRAGTASNEQATQNCSIAATRAAACGGGGAKSAVRSAPTPATSSGIDEDKAAAAAAAAVDTQAANIPASSSSPLPPIGVWAGQVADALIENHLRHTHRALSLALFSTEAEVVALSSDGAPASEEAMLRGLFALDTTANATQPSPSAAAAHEAASNAAGKALPRSAIDSIPPSPPSSSSSVSAGVGAVSVLQRLVERHLRRSLSSASEPQQTQRFALTCNDQCTQTEEGEEEKGKRRAGVTLEARLAAIDAEYALRFAQLRRPMSGDGNDTNEYHTNNSSRGACAIVPGRIGEYTLDRRLERYKQEMHELLRAEYARQQRVFEQDALQRVRDEAEARSRLYIENKEAEYAEKERSAAAKQAIAQEELREGRALLEQQRAALEARKREMSEQTGVYEAEASAARSETQAMKEKMRGLQLQCAQWQELATTRLMEAEAARAREQRRVEEMRVMQKDHDAELRLKDEELMQLRLKLRVLMRHGGFAAALTATQYQQQQPQQASERVEPSNAATPSQTEAAGHIEQTGARTRRTTAQRPVSTTSGSPLMAQLAAVSVAEIAPLPQPPKESASAVALSAEVSVVQEAASSALSPPPQHVVQSPAQLPLVVADTQAIEVANTAQAAQAADKLVSSFVTAETDGAEEVQKTPVTAVFTSEAAAPPQSPAAANNSNGSSSSSKQSTTTSAPKSSSSEQPSSSNSTTSEEEKVEEAAAAAAAQREAERQQQVAEAQRDMQQSESEARRQLGQEEEQARQGLQWSAKAQLDVLRAQAQAAEQARHNNNNNNSDDDEDDEDSAGFFLGSRAGRRAGVMQLGGLDAASQAGAARAMVDPAPIIRHDSDDEDKDDEAILFGRKRNGEGNSSSSSSF